MRSIKARMTISLLTAMLLLLALGALTVYVSVRSWMLDQFDQALQAKAGALVGMMKNEHGDISFELNEVISPDFRRDNRPEYFQIRTADGKSIGNSRSLNGEGMAWPDSLDSASQIWNLRLPDGRMGRVIFLQVSPESEREDGGENREDEEHGHSVSEQGAAGSNTVQIMLARNRKELDKNLRLLLGGALGFSVIMLLGVGFVIPIIVRQGLRPVTNMAGHIQKVDSNTLDQRLSGAGVPQELKTIYSNYNELLERIEEAFLREKRMTADMAHELKTPIAELRALADVSLKHPDDAGFALESLQDVNHVAIQMESIVSAMLTLSRVEAGIEPLDMVTVDLVALIDRQWHVLQDIGRRKSIVAELHLPEAMPIRSNPAMLTSILRNLLENAFEYCPEKGKVSCRLTESDSRAILELQNSNTTLKADDLPRMLKPFWRKQTSRTDDNHSGLGLSLVQALAQALSATIDVSISPDDDIIMRLDIPINPDQDTEPIS
jgi:two-component system, OmpR family, heavy metal sensor histidine kinase CusS